LPYRLKKNKEEFSMLKKTLKHCAAARVLFLLMMLLSAAVLSGSLPAAKAATEQSSEVLDTGQTVNGPGFFAGNLVRVDGTVEGTTFAFGQEVRINGVINGDLFVAAQVVSINGKINGNIYSAGQNVTIGTQSTGDVFLAGQTIDITKDAVLGRDLFVAGAMISHDGIVQRHFSGGGSDISISGSVGQDANLEANNIKLLEGAVIKGNLSYKGPNKANIAAGSKISGKTDWQYKAPTTNKPKITPASFIGNILLSIASALLIWFLVRIWRPDFWTKNARLIAEQPLKTLGTGALALLVTPLLVILIMITVIGMPVGIILGIVYGISLYLSKIVVAVFIGSWLTKRFGWTERHKGLWPVLLGLVILVLLTKVPILGALVWLVVAFAGLGSLILSNYKAPDYSPGVQKFPEK
jgi:cytoskeletal protein CcmA (bactofilin family)